MQEKGNEIICCDGWNGPTKEAAEPYLIESRSQRHHAAYGLSPARSEREVPGFEYVTLKALYGTNGNRVRVSRHRTTGAASSRRTGTRLIRYLDKRPQSMFGPDWRTAWHKFVDMAPMNTCSVSSPVELGSLGREVRLISSTANGRLCDNKTTAGSLPGKLLIVS